MRKIIILIAFIILSTIIISAQSGGTFQITQSVTGNGGGDVSGGTFSLSGTVGQTVTDQSSQVPFSLYSGFWSSSFSPTAAGASISGRVLTLEGRGLRNAVVQLTDASGISRTTRTSSFGNYTFSEIESGQTVVISIASKRYQYQPQVVSLNENLTEINFMPIAANSKQN